MLGSPVDQLGSELFDRHSVSEHEIRRDSLRVERLEHTVIGLDVDPHESYAARVFLRQCFDDRQLPDTSASPLCIKIDDHDALAGVDLLSSRFRREDFELRGRRTPKRDR